MTSSGSPEGSPELRSPEPPECPVCLSPFAADDGGGAAPRVLPCGHSICGSCVASLPPPLAAAAGDAVRCPLCMQVVPYPRALGRNALPKNLALYPYMNPCSDVESSRVKAKSGSGSGLGPGVAVLPVPWIRRENFAEWKNLMMPEKAIGLCEIRKDGANFTFLGVQSPQVCEESSENAVVDGTLPVGEADLCKGRDANVAANPELPSTSVTGHIDDAVEELQNLLRKGVSSDGDRGCDAYLSPGDGLVFENRNLEEKAIPLNNVREVSNEDLNSDDHDLLNIRDNQPTLENAVPMAADHENEEVSISLTVLRSRDGDENVHIAGSVQIQPSDSCNSSSPEVIVNYNESEQAESSPAGSSEFQKGIPSEQVFDSFCQVFVSRTTMKLGSPWFCKENHLVSLLPITKVASFKAGDSWCRPTYGLRILDMLDSCDENLRKEIRLLVEASAMSWRLVSRVLGVWMSIEETESERKQCLYMVFERSRVGQAVSMKGQTDDMKMTWFIFVAMHMCEALMAMHSEGIVCGCLGLSCFSFDEYGRCILDLSRELSLCRKYRKLCKGLALGIEDGEASWDKTEAFIAPELHALLYSQNNGSGCVMCPKSDVWSLACLFIFLLTGDKELICKLNIGLDRRVMDELTIGLYQRPNVTARLKSMLGGPQYDSLVAVICACMSVDPNDRPTIMDLLCSFRSLLLKSSSGTQIRSTISAVEHRFKCCLLFSELSSVCVNASNFKTGMGDGTSLTDPFGVTADSTAKNCISPEYVGSVPMTSKSNDGFKTITLHGHSDCVVGLVIGGEFLFSSSYDKTIKIWSLKDLSLVHTLKGHEHRIMALVTVDNGSNLFCISGDYGASIFVWSISFSASQEPLMKWHEHTDWRFSGVHCLAVSRTGYLYSGSGDRSIKVWSLQDYSLFCTLTGHKSTVSSLVVASGILYSGSWDGTIRLWWLSDHSPLSELQGDDPRNVAPVLRLSTKADLIISAHENGYMKIWKNHVLVRSQNYQTGAVYALQSDQQYLYSGGWDKTIIIQELSESDSEVEITELASIDCESVITSLLYWHGRIFVGLANNDIKVFCKGS